MYRTIIFLSLILLLCSCGKDEVVFEDPPVILVIESQADIDKYTNAIINGAELNHVIFNTDDNLSLEMFNNVTELGELYVQTCQQIEAFPKLQEAEIISINRLNEGCLSFEFPVLKKIGDFLAITRNDFLESFSFPALEEVGVLEVSQNQLLQSLSDFTSLMVLDDLVISSNPSLTSINGFQNSNSSKELGRYQVIFDKYVEYGTAFRSLEHIWVFSFTAHHGADMDWVSTVKSPNSTLNFSGPIAPDELCGLVSIIEDSDNVTVTLNSWSGNTIQFYANEQIVDLCN